MKQRSNKTAGDSACELPYEWEQFRQRLQARAVNPELVGTLVAVVSGNTSGASEYPPIVEAAMSRGNAGAGMFLGQYCRDGAGGSQSERYYAIGDEKFSAAVRQTLAETSILPEAGSKSFLRAMASAAYAKRPQRVKLWPTEGLMKPGRPTEELSDCQNRVVIELPGGFGELADLLPEIRARMPRALTEAEAAERYGLWLRTLANALADSGGGAEASRAVIQVRRACRSLAENALGRIVGSALLEKVYSAVASPDHPQSLASYLQVGLTPQQCLMEHSNLLMLNAIPEHPPEPVCQAAKERNYVAGLCIQIADRLERPIADNGADGAAAHDGEPAAGDGGDPAPPRGKALAPAGTTSDGEKRRANPKPEDEPAWRFKLEVCKLVAEGMTQEQVADAMRDTGEKAVKRACEAAIEHERQRLNPDAPNFKEQQQAFENRQSQIYTRVRRAFGVGETGLTQHGVSRIRTSVMNRCRERGVPTPYDEAASDSYSAAVERRKHLSNEDRQAHGL